MHLHHEIAGNPDGLPVLLLHGYFSSNWQWAPNVDALGARHRLVMVELWGHGASPVPGADRFTVAAYVAEFERLRVQLGVSRWHLVGQSYGAGIMLRYAMACPEVVRSVTVTNSRSGLGTIDREKASRVRTREDVWEPRAMPFHPIHARRFPEALKARMVAAADAISREAAERSGKLGATLNCAEDLDQVAAPMLLVNGVWEKGFQEDAARLGARYSGLQVVDLEGGHSVNIEAAEGFDAALLGFWARCESQV